MELICGGRTFIANEIISSSHILNLMIQDLGDKNVPLPIPERYLEGLTHKFLTFNEIKYLFNCRDFLAYNNEFLSAHPQYAAQIDIDLLEKDLIARKNNLSFYMFLEVNIEHIKNLCYEVGYMTERLSKANLEESLSNEVIELIFECYPPLLNSLYYDKHNLRCYNEYKSSLPKIQSELLKGYVCEFFSAGNYEVVVHMFVSGIISSKNSFDYFPRACVSGNLNLVKYLISKNVDPFKSDIFCPNRYCYYHTHTYGSLWTAAFEGHLHIVEYLCTLRQIPTDIIYDLVRALVNTSSHNVIKYLIVKYNTYDWFDMLLYACKNSSVELVRFLLDRKSSIDRSTLIDKSTVLISNIKTYEQEYITILDLLIDHGLNIHNFEDLETGIKCRDYNKCLYLLDKGFDITGQEKKILAIISRSFIKNQEENIELYKIFRLLVSRGFNIHNKPFSYTDYPSIKGLPRIILSGDISLYELWEKHPSQDDSSYTTKDYLSPNIERVIYRKMVNYVHKIRSGDKI